MAPILHFDDLNLFEPAKRAASFVKSEKTKGAWPGIDEHNLLILLNLANSGNKINIFFRLSRAAGKFFQNVYSVIFVRKHDFCGVQEKRNKSP